MLRPDDAVAGADGPDGQAGARGERLCRLHTVRLHDVGIVFARLDVRLGQVALGVQPLVGGVVLAERVVGEEDVVRRHEGDHVVRPVHHGRGHEGEGALAEREGLARLHADVAELAVVGGKVLHARAGGAYTLAFLATSRMAGRPPLWSGSAWLEMITSILAGSMTEEMRASISSANPSFTVSMRVTLFVEHEVGVVRRAFFRLVAVEVA